MYDPSEIRVTHGLETTITVLKSLLKKHTPLEVIEILCYEKDKDLLLSRLVGKAQDIISSPDESIDIKSLSIELILTLVSAHEDNNAFIGYFRGQDILKVLIQFLKSSYDSTDKEILELDVVTILAILCNCKDEDMSSKIVHDISDLKYTDTAFMAKVFVKLLTDRVMFESPNKSQGGSSWFGFLFRGNNVQGKQYNPNSQHSLYTGAVILLLYKFCYENKCFLDTLFYSVEGMKDVDQLTSIAHKNRVMVPLVLLRMLELAHCLTPDVQSFKHQSFHEAILTVLLLILEKSEYMNLFHQVPNALLFNDFPHLKSQVS